MLKNCFAYRESNRKCDCSVLVDTVCNYQTCKFFKTKEKFYQDLLEAKKYNEEKGIVYKPHN